MNECRDCKDLKNWIPALDREPHCEFCHIGECTDHPDTLAYIQALCVHVCRECADNLLDELRQYKWTT